MKLEPPHSHHLNAAQGWIGLGNANEAGAELDKIPEALQSHPEVLEARWQIYAKTLHWEKCVEVAEQMVKRAPRMAMGWIHRSYALHELKRTREAFDALLPALEKFPKDWLIPYNLACYSCQLGDLDAAINFLGQASQSAGDAKAVKTMALADEDLKELHDRIEKL